MSFIRGPKRDIKELYVKKKRKKEEEEKKRKQGEKKKRKQEKKKNNWIPRTTLNKNFWIEVKPCALCEMENRFKILQIRWSWRMSKD